MKIEKDKKIKFGLRQNRTGYKIEANMPNPWRF